jgi:hypothetical protein
MPRPWFRAQGHNFSIGTVLHVNGALGREGPLFEGERRLGWFVLPPFQRPPVWTEAQKVRFIESAWGGLPLGSYVYNRPPENERTDAWLLDGQQRVTAILEYAAGSFPVMGHRYPELTRLDQRTFEMVTFPALETRLDDVEQLADVYDRLAYGGTPHEPKAARTANAVGTEAQPE